MENGISLNQLQSRINETSVPSIEERTNRFIEQIDKNHERETTKVRTQMIKYDPAKKEKEQAQRRYDQELLQATATARLQSRLEKNEKIRKETRNLKIKHIIMGALIVAGTFSGIVGAYNTGILELNQIQELEQSAEEKIIPTQEEFEAGLTQEQLKAKYVVDNENQELQSETVGRSR